MTHALKALVVDDDPISLEVTCEHLRGAGYAVWSAHNGREGLDAVRELAPDLVVTDMFMPELDGIELVIAIRRERPDAPIIAMSGGGGGMSPELTLRTALSLGASAALPKPLPRERFLTLCTQLTGSSTP